MSTPGEKCQTKDYGYDPAFAKESAKSFVDYCADKFGWSELSGELVMDVGCGVDGFCGTAILDKFPKVGAIFCIDKNRDTVNNFRPKHSRMGCQWVDIERRHDLGMFEGKFAKVVSTSVFHELRDKKEAFRNLFVILRPGGEAAILFVLESIAHRWLNEMFKISKWEEAYEGPDFRNLSRRKRATDYQEIVEKIGFQVIDCEERETILPLPPQRIATALYNIYRSQFYIPSGELDEEFRKDGFEVLSRISLGQTELHLLLKKPA